MVAKELPFTGCSSCILPIYFRRKCALINSDLARGKENQCFKYSILSSAYFHYNNKLDSTKKNLVNVKVISHFPEMENQMNDHFHPDLKDVSIIAILPANFYLSFTLGVILNFILRIRYQCLHTTRQSMISNRY